MAFLKSPADGRYFLYGYNSDEVDLGGVTFNDPPKKDGGVTSIVTSNRLVREPECVSLPCRVLGAVYFRPNSQDPLSAVQGLRKRLVHDRPPVNRRLLKEFKTFVKDHLSKEYVPLRPDQIPSFEEWLAGVNHPAWRKEEYRQAYEELKDGKVRPSSLRKKKCFVKREFYPEPKFHRAIHSPTDYEKVIEGPFAKAIESVVFARPEYIKKIPRAEWPEYIRSRIHRPGWKIFGSDYSSFEANFVPVLQDACEFQLVRYMLAVVLHLQGPENMLNDSLVKYLEARLYIAYIKGRRSSGKMTTSLFNGFSNPMFVRFILRKLGATIVECVVEGDDGLYVHNAPRNPTASDFLALGLTIKIVPVDHWYEASFCGVVTHPDVLHTLCDPWRVVLTCSWAGHEYLRARPQTLRQLAQIKGLSYIAQYPGCPVVQDIGLWILRVTKFDRSKLEELLDWYAEQRGSTFWERTMVNEIRGSSLQPRPIAEGSRQIVARVFGVSVDQQLELERMFQTNQSEIQLDSAMVPAKYARNWDSYVRYASRLDQDLRMPYVLPPASYPANLAPFDRGQFDTPDYRRRFRLPV